MRMLEEEEVEKILKKIDNRIDIENKKSEPSILIMNKKLFRSFDNYMIAINDTSNKMDYDWFTNGNRFYRGLLIIRTKQIPTFLVK